MSPNGMTTVTEIRLPPERLELLRKRYEAGLLQAQHPVPLPDGTSLKDDEGLYCLAGAILTDEEIDKDGTNAFYAALGFDDLAHQPNWIYEATYSKHDPFRSTRCREREGKTFDDHVKKILETGILCTYEEAELSPLN